MSLWTASDAAKATGGRAVGAWACDGVSIDTRTIQPGDLFVALTAARDGHDFVAQALEKGAAAALVSRVPEGVAADAPLLIVDDVQAGLEALGRAGRARCAAQVIAVTGSVGKTSTKEMLLAMLSAQGRTHASVASYNNHWGVPLTLARMPADTQFAVIEIGMNHPGEIAPLARMAAPHAALVTTVAPAHLEAFDDIFGIAHEKASVFDGLQAGGVAVYNADLETSAVLHDHGAALGATLVSFGGKGRDFALDGVTLQGDVTVATASIRGAPVIFKLATPGRHFALNALGALACTKAVGADLAISVTALGRWSPYRGRGQRETIWLDPAERNMRAELIDDSYNANPASMAASLEVLAASTPLVSGGRRVAFLGDMKELGPDEAALHAALADLPAMAQIDQIHCIGPLMKHLHAALPEAQRGEWADTAEALRPMLRRQLRPGDVTLVKGSLSMKLAVIVDGIREMGHPEPPE